MRPTEPERFSGGALPGKASFEACEDNNLRRMRMRKGDAKADRVLFTILCKLLPDGVAGYLQREMNEERATFSG